MLGVQGSEYDHAAEGREAVETHFTSVSGARMVGCSREREGSEHESLCSPAGSQLGEKTEAASWSNDFASSEDWHFESQ